MTRTNEADIRHAIVNRIRNRDGPRRDTVVALVASTYDEAEQDVADVLDRMQREGEIYAVEGHYRITAPEKRARRDGRGRGA